MNKQQEKNKWDPGDVQIPFWVNVLLRLVDVQPVRKCMAIFLLTFLKFLSWLPSKYWRFVYLPVKTRLAWRKGKHSEACRLAEESLEVAENYSDDWNYGNAIHHAQIILGREALRHEDIDAAQEHLFAAGRTPGSPQLMSFGPNMQLAEELLERGRKEAVLTYLDLCRKFWIRDRGRLALWTDQIEKGEIPYWTTGL